MAELKTKPTTKSVSAYLKRQPERRQKDSAVLVAMLRRITGSKPKMWGESIVGFGSYHYESERSSQKGDWPLIGFSSRKRSLTIYIMPGFKAYGPLMKKLGKYKTSVSCLYLNTLDDVDLKVLEQIMKRAVADMRKRYPVTR